MDTKIFNLTSMNPHYYKTSDADGNERPSLSMSELVEEKLKEFPDYKVESLTYTGNNNMYSTSATLVLVRRDILKTGREVLDKIKFNQAQLQLKEKEFSRLTQIDMLSSTGNILMEQINGLKGQIEALKWVTE